MDRRVKKAAPAFRRIALAALVISLLFGSTSCRPFFEREVSSAVLALEGSAEANFAGKSAPLTPNEWVLPGTKIATAPESRLDLMLLPGILIQLSGETEVEITRLRFARDGDETLHPMKAREASIRLLRGTLVGAIGQSQMRSRLFIQSQAGDLTAFDLRTFRFQLAGDTARIMSVRGKIHFKPADDGALLTIKPGYFAVWPSTDREPRPAAGSDADVQAEIPRILRVEKQLFRLQKSLGFGFNPWAENK